MKDTYNTYEEAKMNAEGNAILTVVDEYEDRVYQVVSWDEFRKALWDSACALYDAGWRKEDADQLMDEYRTTAEELEALLDNLKELEERSNKDA